MGQHERAIADYDEGIRLDPTFAPAWFNKGALLANNGYLEEALPCFERAGQLGDPDGFPYAARVRRTLEQAPAQANPNDPQAAFEAFLRADSPDAMEQAVRQFMVLAQMIPAIEQVIQQQVSPEHRSALEQKLAWLRQIVENED